MVVTLTWSLDCDQRCSCFLGYGEYFISTNSRTEMLHILILVFSCWEGQYSCLISLLCPINMFLLVFLIVIIKRLKVIAEGGFFYVDVSLVCLLVDCMSWTDALQSWRPTSATNPRVKYLHDEREDSCSSVDIASTDFNSTIVFFHNVMLSLLF